MSEETVNTTPSKKGGSSDMLLLVGALIVIGGMAAWFFLGSNEKVVDDAPIVTAQPEEQQVEQVSAVVSEGNGNDELLSRARLAAEAGMLVEPAGTNALYYYSLLLEQTEDDAEVQAEVDALVDLVGTQIVAATDDKDYTRARYLSDQIVNAGMSHPAVGQLELRIEEFVNETTEDALANAADGDESGANEALQRLENLPGFRAADLQAIRGDVRNALDEKLAADAAEEQRAAQEAAEAAARREGIAAAAQSNTASAIEEINAAISTGEYPKAVSLFEELPASSDGVPELRQVLSNALARNVRELAAGSQPEAAEAALARWRSVGANNDQETSLLAAIEQSYVDEATAQIVSASVLTRTLTIPPVYPRGAIRRELSGRIKLEFIVGTDGVPTDIEVVETVHNGVFDRSAIRAVSGWRYDPRVVRGQPVDQRVFTYLDYNLE